MPIAFQDFMGPGDGIEEMLDVQNIGFQARRTCLVAWDDRWTFINEKMLTAWPYHNVNAYCVQGKAKPFPDSKTLDGGGGLLDFDKALVTLFYTSNIRELTAGVIGWERLRGATDSFALKMPSSALFWNSAAGTAVATGDAPSYVTFPGMTYERGYIGLSSFPTAVITLLGGVNNAALVSLTLGVTFAAETIRYADFASDRQISPSGGNTWKATYFHHYKPNVDSGGTARGWNWFWNPAVNNFQPVYLASGVQAKPNFPVNLSLIYP